MRQEILNFIRRELIGPDPVKPHIQPNGEEILLNEPPRIRYGAGVLFPSPDDEGNAPTYSSIESTTSAEAGILDNEIELDEDSEFDVLKDNGTSSNVGDDFEEEIGLANNYLPSAMGFSCFFRVPKEGIKVTVTAGIYEVKDYEYEKDTGTRVSRKAYYRTSLNQDLEIPVSGIPVTPGTSENIKLKDNAGKYINIVLNIRNRTHGDVGKDVHLLTFTLINRHKGHKDNIRNEDCFFQVSFSVKSNENSFLPYKMAVSRTDRDDEKSNQLLYRKKKTFAVGHGCSPSWEDIDTISVNCIKTESIPSYEIKPIVPNELPSIALKMFDLSDLSSNDDVTLNLTKMNLAYEKWIDEQEQKARAELNGEFLLTALRHISSCKACLKRMVEGVNLLKVDKQLNRAFRLMNRAMLLQQLHYGIELRKWTVEKGAITGLESAEIPDINTPETWQKNPDGSLRVGAWRPFQIAFILMNLNAMQSSDHPDREIVDLIWFPTGGGKTEAYLGLSALSIFLRRLKKVDDTGTTVLMRYTLRLLTAQQFQRAAALICACEKIRTENLSELGSERISIGLWVGELTPNKRGDALSALKKLGRREDENPFVVLKCPWCGAQMGPIKDTNKDEIKGYKTRKVKGHETVVFKCDNVGECNFSSEDSLLPLLVIDEDIYETPPTLLIGTVDKFAMLTWRPEARSLFGFIGDTQRSTPPELIIQDELHLISGPLGSMVGLYETMIEQLCIHNGIKPKIIASSATISRAKEQINSLYGRGTEKVSIFPAQCLNAGDSFFAFEEQNSVKSPGRLYVGIFASALPSHATAQVRIISALLQSVKSIPAADEKMRDPYWTILAYFNSIRELGHAATLIRADIAEYLNSIYVRRKIRGNERRFVNTDRELTSRINSSQITDILEDLIKEYPKEKNPIDICLATNMISVGVDISRLGLMTVVGQPKTTSEYIQATSRVGRSKKGPGLVLTVYNCSKPRDRSHFEHFQEYHSKIYSKVEPTSVTPFSPPARERALHAIMVGLIRFYSENNRKSPTPLPDKGVFQKIKDIISKRVSDIDPEELNQTIDMLERRFDQWRHNMPIIYGTFTQTENLPLMYPAGTTPSEAVKFRAWSTPTSMRNVDATCDALIVNEYINLDNN